eukprot:s105_g20.t2
MCQSVQMQRERGGDQRLRIDRENFRMDVYGMMTDHQTYRLRQLLQWHSLALTRISQKRDMARIGERAFGGPERVEMLRDLLSELSEGATIAVVSKLKEAKTRWHCPQGFIMELHRCFNHWHIIDNQSSNWDHPAIIPVLDDSVVAACGGVGSLGKCGPRNSRYVINKVLQNLELSRFFAPSLIFGFEDFGDEVPKSSVILKHILPVLSLPASSGVFVDDDPSNGPQLLSFPPVMAFQLTYRLTFIDTIEPPAIENLPRSRSLPVLGNIPAAEEDIEKKAYVSQLSQQMADGDLTLMAQPEVDETNKVATTEDETEKVATSEEAEPGPPSLGSIGHQRLLPHVSWRASSKA